MEEVTASTDLITCPITGETCPRRQVIVETYGDDNITITGDEGLVNIDDSLYLRQDRRMLPEAVVLHNRVVELEGCEGVVGKSCGISERIRLEQRSRTLLGRLATKLRK